MALHEKLTDEAEARLAAEKKRRFWGSLMVAGFALIFLGIILGAYFVYSAPKSTPIINIINVDDTQNREAPRNNQRRHPRPSVPRPIVDPALDTLPVPRASESNRINPDVNAATPSPVADADGYDVPSIPGDSPATIKEVIGSLKGPGLTGTFYDLKQTQGGRPTNVTPSQAALILRDFVTKKWDERQFAKYYQSPVQLNNPFFFMPRMKATAAPAAFKCADRVKDSRWVAIYRGQVKVPASGTYRFVGAGDDAIVVRFNNRVVFDYGWYQLSLGKIASSPQWRQAMASKTGNDSMRKELERAGINKPPVTFYTYAGTPHWNNSIGGLACGPTFRVEEGKVYPIEVLISEIPGGEFGAMLLIENMDYPAPRKDRTGSPVLPLFRVAEAIPDLEAFKGQEYPSFDPIGPVWQVQQEQE